MLDLKGFTTQKTIRPKVHFFCIFFNGHTGRRFILKLKSDLISRPVGEIRDVARSSSCIFGLLLQ